MTNACFCFFGARGQKRDETQLAFCRKDAERAAILCVSGTTSPCVRWISLGSRH